MSSTNNQKWKEIAKEQEKKPKEEKPIPEMVRRELKAGRAIAILRMYQEPIVIETLEEFVEFQD